MIFSELYSAYYNVMAKIIDKAIEHPLEKGELREIVEKYAFGESILNIEPAILEEKWQLIKKDGTTPLTNKPELPLTNLQKSWLKAISLDSRIKLFGNNISGLEDVEPLFKSDDILIFDKYSDGDPYDDENYIKNFRMILDAIKNRYPLQIDVKSRNERPINFIIMPEYLEYSAKDDKFRLIGSGSKYGSTINLARITLCEPYEREFTSKYNTRLHSKSSVVEFELVDERNALERVLLHFAHFEKQAERLDDKRYKISVTYNEDDETEVLIRILSFGPMVKVTGSKKFVELIKERLIKQKSCEH